MKINKKFFICAMLVLMLFLCINASSAAEPLNETLEADIGDAIAISDASGDELSASGDTLVVDANGGGQYTSISAAVSDATGGETILIKNGNYDESRITGVNKQLTFAGESKDGVIITASSSTNGFFYTGESGYTSLTFKDLTFKDIAGGGSGPIVIGGDGDVTIKNCIFDGCSSKYGSFRVYTSGVATVEDCTIINSKSTSTAGSSGFTIAGSGAGDCSVKNVLIDNAVASNNNFGVAYFDSTYHKVNVENLTIVNSSGKVLGAVYTKGNTAIKNSKFTGNSFSRDYSGVLYVNGAKDLTVESSVISENSGMNYLITTNGASTLDLNYNNIHDNVVSTAYTNPDYGTYTLEANYWGSNDLPDGVTASTWVVDNNGNYELNTGEPLAKDIPGLTGGDEPGPQPAAYDVYVSPDGDGDGSSYETPMSDFMQALENVPDGGSIFFLNGEYYFEWSPVLYKNVALVGESRDGVILTSSSSGTALFTVYNVMGDPMEDLQLDFISISDMTFSEVNIDPFIWVCSSVNEFNVTNCMFTQGSETPLIMVGFNVMNEPYTSYGGTFNFKKNVLTTNNNNAIAVAGLYDININNNIFIDENSGANLIDFYSEGEYNVDYNYWGSNDPATSLNTDDYIIFTASSNATEIYNDESAEITIEATLNDGTTNAKDYLPDYPIEATLTAAGDLSANTVALQNAVAQVTYSSDVARNDNVRITVLGQTLTVPIKVKERYTGIIYVATTGSDDNEGSESAPVATVAKAIELALGNGGSGEIIINEGTYVGNGYQVTKDLTITGVGSVTLDADGQGGLFSTGYPTDASKFVLNNLTLTGANSGYGQAINSFAGELILNNVNITNNPGTGSLIKQSGKLTMDNCVIANHNGGSVIDDSSSADIVINNTLFENNIVTDYAIVYLSSTSGNLIVENTQFINNSGKLGILKSSKKTTIDNSKFIDNTNTNGYGGAISDCDTLTVTDSTFINNKAARSAGAISVGYNRQATIEHSIFINNVANTADGDDKGDAISTAGTLTINNCILLTDSSNSLIYNAQYASSTNAQNNWWGTNDDPSSLNSAVSGEIDVSNWATMDASFTPSDAQAGEEVTVTAVFSNANLPDGIEVTFTSTSGNLNTVVSTVDAQASTTYTIDANDEAIVATSTNAVVEMPIEEGFTTNVVTNDTFYNFFDESGMLKDTVPYDELIFQGVFSDLAAGYVIITKPVTITGDEAVLSDMGIMITSENVAVDNLTLIATTSLGSLITVTESNVDLTNLIISYIVDDDEAIAIDVRGTDTLSDINILDNSIYFESHVSDDEGYATAINLEDVEDVIVDGNTIYASVPALYVETYDYTYFMMGLVYVNPIRIYEASGLEFTNNNVDVTINDCTASYPTAQAIYLVGSEDVLIKGNNFTMIDTETPLGTSIYLYAVECGFSDDISFIENNFNISTTGGKSGAGSAYALQVATSEVEIIGNNITCDSNGPNLGIFSPYGFGRAKDMDIENNFLNITGYAAGSNEFALISGIEIQTGYATIYNNTIYAQNKGDYDDAYPVSGISAVQYSASTLTFDVKDNEVYTNGKYAVEMLYPPQSAVVVNNTLYAYELTGDGAVYIKSGDNNEVHDNLPAEELTNVVTNDTFYKFFDENGNLLDTITFDELIFNGTFSDLTDMIVFNRAINVTGEDAVLDNIAIRIAASDVSLSGFALTADKEFADNNGALIYATGANIEISDVIANYVAPSEAEAIAIYANAAENFTLVSSEIIYEATNPGSNHNYGLEVRDSNNVNIADNIITAVLPSVDVSYSSTGIDADLVLAVGIQGGNNVNFTSNVVDVTTNGGVGYYPTIDAIMIDSTTNVLLNSNNITHIDTTTSDTPRYYYSVDLHGITGIVEDNNIVMNTTSGIDRSGAAYPIQLTGPFTVTVNNNNLTSISKGPNAGIYASNWNGPGDLTATGNNINITGYATAGGYALVAGIEAEIDLAKVYNNTINVYNLAEYDDTNPVYGVSMTSSYMSAAPVADIKDNTITVDGKYAVYYASAENTNVTGNTLYAHELKGDGAAAIDSGDNNIIENNLPAKANITVEAVGGWIGTDGAVTVTVPNATGTVTIEVNGKSYDVELVDGVATKEIPAEDLVLGENIVTATYNGPDFASNTATGSVYVVDGIVTQDTYMYYFNQDDNGRLFDYVPEGATLDFQGSIINPDQSITVQMNVNKPVNIVSTTGDAYVDLNTTAGSLLGESPGNSFAITNGGSGSNVTGIYFHNSQLWISNTHDVVLDNISVVVEDQRVGSGVGATTIRDNSSNVILKNSYLYTRNNGGSTTFTMSWATNCTIDNCTVKAEGNVGNLIYLNVYNIVGAPSGVPLNNYNTVSNNKIYGKEGSAISVGLMVEGSHNLIVNNTLYKSSISTSFGGVNPNNNTYVGNVMTDGSGLTAQAYSIVYGNNVTGALSTGKGSVAYDNLVGGKLSVGQEATAYDNTVGNGLETGGTDAVIENNTIAGAVAIKKVGTTFVGNNVTGTVTVSVNNNVIKGNNITSTGNYAIDLGSKTGNNVTDNYLVSALYMGDAAVKFTNENNIVENNTPVPTEIVIVSDLIRLNVDDEVDSGASLTPADAGELTFTSSDESVAIVENGKIKALAEGTAVITVSYAGDDKYHAAEDKTITVQVAELFIEGYDVDMTYEDGSAYMVQLIDKYGNPVAKAKEAINITIHGRTYTRLTNDSGIAKVTIHLNASSYEATAQYGKIIVSNMVVVHKLPIVGYDVNMVYKDGSAYIVQLVDSEGNPFAKSNQAINITIAGKSYTRYTNASGAAKITINLAPGTYDVTAQYGDMVINNVVTVNKLPIVGYDVNMTYKDGSAYMVQLVDENGNPFAKANEAINITIDGKTYTRYTNASGVAKVTINLRAGEYPVTAQYGDTIIENVVTVNNKYSIAASDLVMSYKDGSAFEVQLLDENGDPCALSNEPVKITVAGKTYTRYTDDNGVARIVINLGAGTYSVTTAYNNKTLSNTITVNKA